MMKALKYTGPVWWYLLLLCLAWANAVPFYLLALAAMAYPAKRMGEFGAAELQRELAFFHGNRRMQQVKIAGALLLVGLNAAMLGLVAMRHVDTLNFVALLFAAGYSNGVFLLSLAHDLAHAASRPKRMAGNLLLFALCLPFFRADHIYGHHELVGTDKDAGSARPGQPFYRFLGRVFLQRIQRSYSRQSDLPQACKKTVLRNNFLFTGLLALFAAALFAIDPLLLLFWLGQNVLAYCLYELTNYIQHYGLRRAPGEAVGMNHSWNCYYRYPNRISWFLFAHSPHHVGRPQDLTRLHDGPRLPYLPYRMFLLALIPRLWFRLMDPLVLQKQNDYVVSS